ncbi:MAG: hypothetical protein K6B44_11580 [Lachnospiraceae bacterium]|nr:hypothetical protein [Lachnospiraceae bacterium]
MTAFEIILLVVGLIIFVISFFLPGGSNENNEINTEQLGTEELRSLIDEELANSKSRLDEMTDETIEYSMEKAERTLERITNEKIMAIGDYSDAVMSGISNSHQENMFLHEMLGRNKDELTDLLNHADQTARDAQVLSNNAYDLASAAKQMAENAYEQAQAAGDRAVFAEEKMIDAKKVIKTDEIDAYDAEPADVYYAEEEEEEPAPLPVKKPVRRTRKSASSRSKLSGQMSIPEELFPKDQDSIDLNFSGSDASEENNNEKILSMHRMGRSNMAIAKELGLGLGEVKLVIDLFENS